MAEKAPTKGPRANVQGKYWTLSPKQFSSPAEYQEAKIQQYQEWRDGLQTPQDYNNAARELLSQQTAGDRFQQYNVRDGLATIQYDAQQQGVPLDDDVKQGLGEYSQGELQKIFAAYGQGMMRGPKGGRRPGEKPAEKAKPKEETPNNVAVRRRRKAKGEALARRGNFKTPPGSKPVAWTNGAQAEARRLGTPMEGTPGGQAVEKFLGNKKDMSEEDKYQIWESSSDTWSKNAAKEVGPGGTVDVATNGAPVRDASVFNRIEDPNFKAGGVTPVLK